MGYTTYEFYTDKYYGDSIAESDFDKWNDRASRQLDVLTSKRLQSAYPQSAKEDIQLCVCDLAEHMMEIDKYKRASQLDSDGKANLIKSESAGSESITYATTETRYSEALQGNMNSYYYSVASPYLNGIYDTNGIPLLYMGV